MTTQDAYNFVMPFGKHSGRSFRDIAVDHADGARYLDWVVGLDDLDRYPYMKEALETFLAIPWVAKVVAETAEYRGPGSTEPIENRQAKRQWWEK